MTRTIAISAAAMIPIMSAAFSAASEVIRLLLLFLGGVGIGGYIGGGGGGGGSVISVVVDCVVTGVDRCVTTLLQSVTTIFC